MHGAASDQKRHGHGGFTGTGKIRSARRRVLWPISDCVTRIQERGASVPCQRRSHCSTSVSCDQAALLTGVFCVRAHVNDVLRQKIYTELYWLCVLICLLASGVIDFRATDPATVSGFGSGVDAH